MTTERAQPYTGQITDAEQTTEIILKPLGKAEDSIVPDDLEEMIKSELPHFSNPRKGQFLAYKATGFSTREACNLVGVRQGIVSQWRREDPEFARYEKEGLFIDKKKGGLARTILTMEFMRNMRLALRKDFKVLYKANYNLEGMTMREWEYLKVVRRHYTPTDLIALDKATEPESTIEDGATIHAGSLTVVVDNRQVDDRNSQNVAARELLEKFTSNQKFLREVDETIEGELVSGD